MVDARSSMSIADAAAGAGGGEEQKTETEAVETPQSRDELPRSVGCVGLRRGGGGGGGGTILDLSELEALIPVGERKFYSSQLTTADKTVLQRVLAKAGEYESVAEVLADLRKNNGSKPLYDRTVALITGVRATIAGLSEAARRFVDQTAENVQRAVRGGGEGEDGDVGGITGITVQRVKSEAVKCVQRFRALDNATKAELRAAFPAVDAVVSNPTFQLLASGLLGISSESVSST